MRAKSPKQQLNVIPKLQYESKKKAMETREQKKEKPEVKSIQQSCQLPFPAASPKKHEELKRVQDDIQVMRNKIVLLNIQLQKQQQSITVHKSRTEDIIRKKINVDKVQKYKVRDKSVDIERVQQLRARNASLRESRQSQMQNIFKAIYLVKLDDAREIKNMSKGHRKKIEEMNDANYNQQLQKKKKIAQDSQRAKQKYQRYWQQKLASIQENEGKNRKQINKVVKQKKDQLHQLRQQEIKLLENFNKVQNKQLQSKKQYLAALTLPVKEVAEALNRSKSNMDGPRTKDKSDLTELRLNSEMSKSNSKQGLTYNSSSRSDLQSLRDLNDPNQYKKVKVPNSSVNKEKLAVILKQLKRLDKKQKAQKLTLIQ